MGKGSGGCAARPSLIGEGNTALLEMPPASLAAPTLETTVLPANHPAVLDAAKYPKHYNSKKLNYEIIDDEAGLQRVIDNLSRADVTRIGLDIETTGNFAPWKGSVRLIQIGVEEPEPKQYLIQAWQVDPRRALEFFTDPAKETVTCNGVYEQQHLLYRYNIEIANMYDVSNVSKSIGKIRNEIRKQVMKHNFRSLARRYLGAKISKAEQNSGWNQEELSASQCKYAAYDVAGLLDIRRQMGLHAAEIGVSEDMLWQANHVPLFSARKGMIVSANQRNDQADRIVRALRYAQSADEIDEYATLIPRLPINYKQLSRLESMVAERKKELSLAA